MSTLNFGTVINLDEAATLIRTCPDNRFFLRGEPGIGKSSIMGAFKRHFGDAYAYAYFDCAQKDLGDIAMPSINREQKVTEYFPNAVLQLQTGKPVIIMLDEFTKAPQPVQNMLHPLLEAHNPRLGDIMLPEGSIVFLTGNMASDGVGDNIKAHTLNRVTTVTVRKPTAEEWLGWAVNNDIDPVIMAWVDRFPHALDSYMDGDQSSNPYIFNPKKMQGAFVSPRSLERVSNVVKKREQNTANAILAAMIGTIGESGARDMHAFVEYQDQLPTWDAIIADPKKAQLPESPGACAVMVFGGVARVDAQSITPFMEYIERMEPEWHSVAFKSAKFRDWCYANEDIL
jgi:AAA domain (dynein-related subfamily)